MKKIVFFVFLVLMISCVNTYHSKTTSKDLNTKNELDKLVLIEPDFIYRNFRDDESYKYFKSDEKDVEYVKILEKNAHRKNFDLKIFDKKSLSKDDVMYYDELIPLKNEILTNLSKLSLSSKKGKKNCQIFKNTPIIDPKYSALIKEYDTKYFAITGMISTISKARINWLWLPVAPLMVYTFAPYKESLYYFVVVNVESGEIEYQEIRFHNERMTKTNMNIYVYDTFNALKKTGNN